VRSACLSFACLCMLSSFAAEGVPPKMTELDQAISGVLPKPDEERWLQIQWRLDFAAARAEANDKGKPLFLWMMDVHPLGCT